MPPVGCRGAEDAAELALLQLVIVGSVLSATRRVPAWPTSPGQGCNVFCTVVVAVNRCQRALGNGNAFGLRACDARHAVRSEQVASLYERFRKLDREKHGVLTKKELMMVPELAMNPLADRLVDVVLAEGSDGAINFRDFLRLLACFHVRSDASLTRLFQLFDEDGDGMLSRADLRSTIRQMVGPGPEVGADGSSSSKQKVVVTDDEVDSMVDSTAEALGIKGGDGTADLAAFLAYARACGLDKLMQVRVAVGTEDDEEEGGSALGH